MTEERGAYVKLTPAEEVLRDQMVVDAYVEGATAKTRYPAFLRMWKQTFPGSVENMTPKKFDHYFERLPPEKKREIQSRRLLKTGVSQNMDSKKRREQQKWATGIHFRVLWNSRNFQFFVQRLRTFST
jgi:hypothetical protein